MWKRFVLCVYALVVVSCSALFAMDTHNEDVHLKCKDANGIEHAIKVNIYSVRQSKTISHLLDDCEQEIMQKGLVLPENCRFKYIDMIFNQLLTRVDTDDVVNFKPYLDDLLPEDIVRLLLTVNYLDILIDKEGVGEKSLLDILCVYWSERVCSNPFLNKLTKEHLQCIPKPLIDCMIEKILALKQSYFSFPIVFSSRKAEEDIDLVHASQISFGLRFRASLDKKTITIVHENKEEAVCQGHADEITQVCTIKAKDGIRILSASSDHTLRIWNEKGKELKTFRVPGFYSDIALLCAVEKEEGMAIVLGSCEALRFWDQDGKLRGVLRKEKHGGRITSVHGLETKKGVIIAVGTFDGSLFIVNEEGKQLAYWQGHEKMVSSVCVLATKKGVRIVSGTSDGLICIWDEYGKKLASWQAHEKKITSVCAVETNKGVRVISASWDTTMRIWDEKGNMLTSESYDALISSLHATILDDQIKITLFSYHKIHTIFFCDDVSRYFSDRCKVSPKKALEELYFQMQDENFNVEHNLDIDYFIKKHDLSKIKFILEELLNVPGCNYGANIENYFKEWSLEEIKNLSFQIWLFSQELLKDKDEEYKKRVQLYSTALTEYLRIKSC